ncbi:MAG: iron-siderophore transporter substrate-binding protein [Proteobacteria bacterium]|nr:iron-siderophore transporter substrate-binding protein [Pseudomonadota bacterium]
MCFLLLAAGGKRRVGDALMVNLEALSPTLILSTPSLDSLTPVLKKITPVLRLSIYDASGGSVLPKAEAATRILGDHLNRRAEADAFLQRADRHFARYREAVRTAGAGILVLADWAGRNLAFLYEMPAGLVAALIGTLLLLALIWRR